MTFKTLPPARAAHYCDSHLSRRFAPQPSMQGKPSVEVRQVEGDNDASALTLTMLQAENLMDRDGYVTVTVRLDQDKYLDHVIASATGDGLNPEDYAHEAAFGFGRPRESSAEIIGVSGSEFIVSYTTFIREYLDN